MTMTKITNTVTYDTPEGIRLELVPAGLVPRAIALIIDMIVRGILVVVLAITASVFGEMGVGLWLLALFLIFWLYPVFFEVFQDGKTLGKRLLKLRVCMDNGMPIGWQASMIRNLLIMADFMPISFFAGVLCILFHKQSKRLGDVLAGTMVVYDEQTTQHFDIQNAPPIATPIPLTLAEQQAILAFVERKESLNDERVVELSAILSPMIEEGNKQLAHLPTIVGYANAIMGVDKVAQPPRFHKKSDNF